LATGSSSSADTRAEVAGALHRLRSTLARVRAELELADADHKPPRTDHLLDDIRSALELIGVIESLTLDIVRVLVVDDDERLGELTARGLRRMGFDADTAVRMRTLLPREILVLDLSLARSLSPDEREAARRSRPIVLTGAVDAASRALADEIDASDYLVKPVDTDVLAAAINRRRARPS